MRMLLAPPFELAQRSDFTQYGEPHAALQA
jgi:hypothetical protein